MKKSLSFLVALALVFGLFASMASAADTSLTTAQKYQQFVDNKILKGDPSGDARLGATLTRAEFVTIADAITGLDTTSATTQTFSDVKKGQWWYGAIEAAAKAGLVNGIGQGKFGPKLNVTVEQAIKVFVIAAGLKPVDGASVDGSSVWAGPYIKAAQDAGFPIPSNYKANATRGQAIDLAYAAYVAKSVPTLSDVKAAVNADDTITVTGKVVGKADSVKVALGTATAVAATLKDDGTFSYTTSAQAAGTYTLTVVAYDGQKASAASTVTATVDGFQVASVTVQNNKQLAIKFNKAVQYGVATGGHNNPSYYTLGTDSTVASSHPTAIDISDDRTLVTLTYGNGFGFASGTYAQFSIAADLKSSSGKSLTAYKQAILLSDTTAPTVSGVSYAGKKATINFSEPLDHVGTLSINGSQVYPAITASDYSVALNYNAVAYGGNITSATITGLTPGTNYAFNLVGGADLAGNAFDYNTTLNVPDDTTPPTVVAVTTNGTVIKAQFSEKLDSSVVGSVYATGETPVAGVIDSNDASIVTYNVKDATTGADWLHGATFRTLSITLKGYADLVGLTGAAYTTTVTVALDQTAPTYSSVFYSNGYVVFQYNENLGTAPTSVNYTFKNSSGLVKSGTLNGGTIGFDANNSGGALDSDEYKYIAFPAPTSGLDAGTYTFSLSGVKDVAGNAAATASPVLAVSSSSGAGVISVAISTYADDHTLNNNEIKFVFTKTVNGTTSAANLTLSQLVASNFLINGSPLPAGTDIHFQDNYNTVVADLPAGAIANSGSRTIQVQNIVDENGYTLNTANSANYQAVKFLTENVKPVATGLTVTSDTTLAVSFNETMATVASSATNGAGIEVYINGNQVAASTLSYSVSGSTLTITANAANTFAATQSIVVKFVGSSVKDFNGNTIADTTVNK